MKVTKYRAPPRDVIFIGMHTSLCTSSKSLEALLAFTFRKRCPSMFAFNASFTYMVQWHFFQIHAIDHILQLLKTRHVEVANLWCQSVAPSFENFATLALSFRTLRLRRYKFFSFCACATTVPWTC